MSKILITGGTRGIGRACALIFADAGWQVTVVARNPSPPPHQNIAVVAADVSTPAGRALLPAINYDVVLLNAAAFRPGALLTGDDTFAEQWPTNVLANHELARTQVQKMLKRAGGGHLVVIGSLGTDYWPEHLTAYVATKYALRGLYEGWRRELAATDIQCTLVAPGATLTSSWDGEVPPPGILAPITVAELVLDVVLRGREGRVTVR